MIKKRKTSWNKGKTKNEFPQMKNAGRKKGCITWNKGKKFPELCKENNPNWRGGKNKHSGYIRILMPNHPFADRYYVYEHRLIVEKQIGRYLLPKEPCHHLGKKDDNHPEKLMAFINENAHQRFHHNPDNVKPKEIIFDGRKINS